MAAKHPLKHLSFWLSGWFSLQTLIHIIAALQGKTIFSAPPEAHWALALTMGLLAYAFYTYGVHQCWIPPELVSFRSKPKKLK
jgi:hypothetical protein